MAIQFDRWWVKAVLLLPVKQHVVDRNWLLPTTVASVCVQLLCCTQLWRPGGVCDLLGSRRWLGEVSAVVKACVSLHFCHFMANYWTSLNTNFQVFHLRYCCGKQSHMKSPQKKEKKKLFQTNFEVTDIQFTDNKSSVSFATSFQIFPYHDI